MSFPKRLFGGGGGPSVMAWMRRTFAVAFVMLGARLALTER